MFHQQYLRSTVLRLMPVLLLVSALCSSMLPAQPVVHSQTQASMPILLRRTTINTDNTDNTNMRQPGLSAITQDAQATLMLMQFDSPPDQQTRTKLEAAGLKVLLDIPENAILVRTIPGQPLPSDLPGLRWTGPYSPAYRLSSDLEAALPGSKQLDVRLTIAPDSDLGNLRGLLAAQGATILSDYKGLNGSTLRVQLPSELLTALIQSPEVLWAELYQAPALTNNSVRNILGVENVQTQYGLDGSGQIIAVTDSGLDSQTALSADFSGRLVRGFGNREMGYDTNPTDCFANNWSDRHGHGTHVSGTALGSGALSAGKYAGIAPGAGVVIQSVSTGGNSLNCLPDDPTFLQQAYDAGARIQNGSYGAPTDNHNGYGGYTQEAAYVDDFLWNHPDHLFVVAAGNSGKDTNFDGITDSDSIGTPGTAKNVLTVGASESEHGVTSLGCGNTIEQLCWSAYQIYSPATLANDLLSNNRNGMAVWSSRGPTDDGRIKPEIVAPGTTIISARSHDLSAHYNSVYNANYAYDWGTSMATPAVSGMAALVRQWLTKERNIANPSAALLKALLLNGATDMSPGQYGVGSMQEISAAWPNNTEGWGRAFLPDTVDLDNQRTIWFTENATGLKTGEMIEYRLNVSAGQPLRLTLNWTDYPATPVAAKALVNNLDLELLLPDGSSLLRGNSSAVLPGSCRSNIGADICNNTESISISAPVAGEYRVRIRATNVSIRATKQPFAVAMRAAQIEMVNLPAPVLDQPAARSGSSLWLYWSAVNGSDFYIVESSQDPSFSSIFSVKAPFIPISLLQEKGTSYYRVRACYSGGCGLPSNVQSYTTLVAPGRVFVPVVWSP